MYGNDLSYLSNLGVPGMPLTTPTAPLQRASGLGLNCSRTAMFKCPRLPSSIQRGNKGRVTVFVFGLMRIPAHSARSGTFSMPNRTTITTCPPAAVEDALRRFGDNLRTARLRRRLRIQDIADRLGSSRFTVASVEKGKPGASAAAYFGVLWALGLLDDATRLADPDRDEEGKVLESARLPTQAPRRGRLHGDF